MSQNVVSAFIKKGFLISPDLLGKFKNNLEFEDVLETTDNNFTNGDKPIVLGDDLFTFFRNRQNVRYDINWRDFDSSKALYEKGKNGKTYEKFLDVIGYKEELEEQKIEAGVDNGINGVKVIKCYDEPPKKRTFQDFVTYFRHRYGGLKRILVNRPELGNVTSINRIVGKNGNNRVAIIGLVSEKRITKNGNIILNLEDLTGNIKVIVTKNGNGILNDAKDIVEDEVIGVVGFKKDDIIFANNIIWPDIPLREYKKAADDVGVAFISDVHVGSKKFLYDEFIAFIEWLNGKVGDEKSRCEALQVKYLFVSGDIIDGCGVFPGQEETLAIKDIEKQYDVCARIFSQIRKDVTIIMCPGQHDSLRLSEPQPRLYRDFASKLWELPNVIMVSNPSLINIHSSDGFPGFDVLMYHGASFHHFISNVDSLRQANPTRNPGVVSKFLIKRRHLAPTFGSTGVLPDTKEDPLVIDRIPDFFISGDMHRTDISNYNGVTIVNSSCWQDKTEFEEKVGNDPDPAKVPIINLKTREIKILNFSS